MNTDSLAKKHRIEARQEQQGIVVNAFGWITCLNCDHFKDDQCSLYNAVPPPTVIVHGCTSYQEKIPF